MQTLTVCVTMLVVPKFVLWLYRVDFPVHSYRQENRSLNFKFYQQHSFGSMSSDHGKQSAMENLCNKIEKETLQK